MMVGTVTKESVEEYAYKHGLTPVQIDGIPEGFSFKKPDIKIGNQWHEGDYIALLPLHSWSESHAVTAQSVEYLLDLYKRTFKKKNESTKQRKTNGQGLEA